MRSTWIIFRKEMRSYFVSPIAYILLAMYTFLFGLFFTNNLPRAVENASFNQQMQQQTLNVNEQVVRPQIMILAFVGIFFIPIITMRIFSEEKRSGTIELLATSPVRDSEIILGKWLAAVAFYGCLLLAGSLNMIFAFVYSHPDLKPLLIGYLGLMLLTGCMLSIGTFVSSLTKNQIIAASVMFVIYLLLWIVSFVTEFQNSTVSAVFSYFSIVSHLESFASGILEIKDLVFYITATFLGLFFTARYLESLRWRS